MLLETTAILKAHFHLMMMHYEKKNCVRENTDMFHGVGSAQETPQLP